MTKNRNYKYCLGALAAVFLLTGCTSSLVLGKFYDGLPGQSAKRFKEYASFDLAQEEQIDQLAASYHSWHRRNQLPSYAALLREVVAEIERTETLEFKTAAQWWASSQGFIDEMRECNPLNASASLLISLSDKQVKQVEATLMAVQTARKAEFKAEALEDRIDRRASEIQKWGKRGGANFNESQQQLLRETLNDQISLGGKRYELRQVWLDNYFGLLKERDQNDFSAKMFQHINSMWKLTESAYPEQWASNRQLWTEFLHGFINLQTDKQRQTLIDKALKTAATLDKLSEKEVSQAAVCHRPELAG